MENGYFVFSITGAGQKRYSFGIGTNVPPDNTEEHRSCRLKSNVISDI